MTLDDYTQPSANAFIVALVAVDMYSVYDAWIEKWKLFIPLFPLRSPSM